MKSVILAPAALPRMDLKLVATQMSLWSFIAVSKPVVQALMRVSQSLHANLLSGRHPAASTRLKSTLVSSMSLRTRWAVAGVIKMTILIKQTAPALPVVDLCSLIMATESHRGDSAKQSRCSSSFLEAGESSEDQVIYIWLWLTLGRSLFVAGAPSYQSSYLEPREFQAWSPITAFHPSRRWPPSRAHDGVIGRALNNLGRVGKGCISDVHAEELIVALEEPSCERNWRSKAHPRKSILGNSVGSGSEEFLDEVSDGCTAPLPGAHPEPEEGTLVEESVAWVTVNQLGYHCHVGGKRPDRAEHLNCGNIPSASPEDMPHIGGQGSVLIEFEGTSESGAYSNDLDSGSHSDSPHEGPVGSMTPSTSTALGAAINPKTWGSRKSG